MVPPSQKVANLRTDVMQCTAFSLRRCAGKTWTMLGPPGKLSEMPGDVKGIMPRALDDLFKALRTDPTIKSWKMAISYVEVYCEVIRDLLTADKMSRDTKGGGVDVQELKGVMMLKGLQPTEVQNMQVRSCGSHV